MHAFSPDGGMGNSAAVTYNLRIQFAFNFSCIQLRTGVITTKPAGRRNRPSFAEIWTVSPSKAEIVLAIGVAPV